jgi:phosphoribosylformylglycinamidine cyclo-ligase
VKNEKSRSLSYRDAGVDIDRGNRLVDRIKAIARATHDDNVLGGVGGFGALYQLPNAGYTEPVLVSATDGVGTKLQLAVELGRHATIGIDLVAMCANDVLAQGAKPLFFLDYFATGRLELDVAQEVIEGIAEGCRLAGAALIGGESAEMPGSYPDGEYDLAGFCVGMVDRSRIIDGRLVQPTDVLIGLPSSGVHSNGYSLVRRIVQHCGADLNAAFDGQADETAAAETPDRTLGQTLLEPTRIYVDALMPLLDEVPVKGIAHITGGGITENLARIIPPGLSATLEADSWTRPYIFDWLQDNGNVTDQEMWRTFNCGLGMIFCVASKHAERTLSSLSKRGEEPVLIGEINALGPSNEVVELE